MKAYLSWSAWWAYRPTVDPCDTNLSRAEALEAEQRIVDWWASRPRNTEWQTWYRYLSDNERTFLLAVIGGGHLADLSA